MYTMMIFGGHRKILFDAFIALILVPSLLYYASQGFSQSIAICTLVSFLAWYGLARLKKPLRFFFIWYFASIIIIYLSFEIIASPLLMISVVEDLIVSFLISLALFCLFVAKYRSTQIYESQSLSRELPLLSFEKDGENILKKPVTVGSEFCPVSKMIPYIKNFQCYLCHICIRSKQQYCIWLDCNINSNNFDFYILGLTFLLFGLIIHFYLILSTVCHNFMSFSVLGISLFLPDDCSDVYYDIITAVCFTSGVYGTLLAVISLHSLISDFLFFIRQSSISSVKISASRIRIS